jgi:hypothetical protein
MKIKTSELTGVALDWVVAKCEGALAPQGNVQLIDGKWLLICVGNDPDDGGSRVYFNPSIDWAQGGEIIEREKIGIGHAWEGDDWLAGVHDINAPVFRGPTPLTAAMRCYVAAKLGEEVDVPEGLQ